MQLPGLPDETGREGGEEEVTTVKHTHIDSGLVEDSEMVALCGGKGWMYRAVDPERATCPTCSAKYYAKLIPANVKLERWDERAERDTNYPNWRSVYRLLIDDVHRGYICAENGWGAGWSARECWNHFARSGLQQPTEERVRNGAPSKERATWTALQTIAAKPDRYPPAKTAEQWQAEDRAIKDARVKAERAQKARWLAECESEIVGYTAELAAKEARLAALRGINVEAPTSVDALRWAIELAQEDIADLKLMAESSTKTRDRLKGELSP